MKSLDFNNWACLYYLNYYIGIFECSVLSDSTIKDSVKKVYGCDDSTLNEILIKSTVIQYYYNNLKINKDGNRRKKIKEYRVNRKRKDGTIN